MRRAGLEISDAEARTFVGKQGIGQVFQGRIPSDGVVVGGGREDHRWQMDLIDFSKRIWWHLGSILIPKTVPKWS